MMPILLEAASSPALRVRAATSLDCPTLAPEISGKRLELLKEIVPRLSRVAVIGTSTSPGTAQVLKETELAAGRSGEASNLDVRVPRILKLLSEPQARDVLMQSLSLPSPHPQFSPNNRLRNSQ